MKKLAILVSGRGSNMLAIINACKEGRLSSEVAVVISNNKDSKALMLAQENGIDAIHLSSRTHPDAEQLDKAISETLQQYQIDLVILAGYMKKIGDKTQAQFNGRILNIHPSLLPKFGGKGMYGLHVHEAVIAAKEKQSGVTIHLVDGDYDEGTILAQQSVAVDDDDTPESLAAKVLKQEHIIYAETIQNIIDGNIKLPNG